MSGAVLQDENRGLWTIVINNTYNKAMHCEFTRTTKQIITVSPNHSLKCSDHIIIDMPWINTNAFDLMGEGHIITMIQMYVSRKMLNQLQARC